MDISQKKPVYPIQGFLRKYLWHYGRISRLPLLYDELMQYSESFPVVDQYGNDTLWESVIYPNYLYESLNQKLTTIYAILRTDGDMAFSEHLSVDRIDYCTFGNTNPFRIRIINRYNDNYDYFYIKRADASRVYGLELEHLLSPNRINFLVFRNTLIEEHIAGIPGDTFIARYLSRPETNLVRIAKEFVKFNERCFVRLLGDMRAYNYVVDITPDFDNEQYRIRAIDFDQQSYDGRYKAYLPQFFKENYPLVHLCLQLLNERTIQQYQQEERTLILRRLKAARYRLKDLIDCMRADQLAPFEKVKQLGQELANYHASPSFLKCQNMGELVRQQLRAMLSLHH